MVFVLSETNFGKAWVTIVIWWKMSFCTQQERGNNFTPLNSTPAPLSLSLSLSLSCLVKCPFLLQQFLHGNWDANSVQYNSLQSPFRARFVRIVPTHWYNQICLRVELYGCKQTWGEKNQRHNFSNLVWFSHTDRLYRFKMFIYRLTHSASKLSGFTCTSSLTMSSKFSIPHEAASCGIENFEFIVNERVQVNPDNSRTMSALTFLLFKLNTLQTKIVKLWVSRSHGVMTAVYRIDTTTITPR